MIRPVCPDTIYCDGFRGFRLSLQAVMVRAHSASVNIPFTPYCWNLCSSAQLTPPNMTDESRLVPCRKRHMYRMARSAARLHFRGSKRVPAFNSPTRPSPIACRLLKTIIITFMTSRPSRANSEKALKPARSPGGMKLRAKSESWRDPR